MRLLDFVSVLIAIHLLPIRALPTAEQDVDAPQAEAEQPALVTFAPASISLTHHIQFKDGREPRLEHKLDMSITCTFEPGVRPSAYHEFEITRVVTDQGEVLAPIKQQRDSSTSFGRHLQQRGDDGRSSTRLYCRLPVPEQPSRALSEISGRMVLELVGDEIVLPIGPIGERVDEHIAVIDDPHSHVVVEDHSVKSLTLLATGPVSQQILDVRFFDADGTSIRSGGGGGSSNSERRRYTYHVELPADGRVELVLAGDTQRHPITFTLSDVPYPGADEPTGMARPAPSRPAEPAGESGVDDF